MNTFLADTKLDFSGRRVLITGGGRGMGKSHVRAFLSLNAQVVVLEKDEELIQQLEQDFPSVRAIQVDLADSDATAKAVEAILPVHHLVNNAAVAEPREFFDIDRDYANRIMNINLMAYLQVGQLVAKGMVQHGISGGTIVNISSIGDENYPVKVRPSLCMYSISKAAVSMLTKVMAAELAPKKIRVNGIRPAAVQTELLEKFQKETLDYMRNLIWHRQTLSDGMPMNALEISKGVLFLSSPLSAMITGTSLTVDAAFLLNE